MKTIVIIGAGQLGTRHLQGLSKIDFPVQIQVVDPFPSALVTAKSRFDEMPANEHIVNVQYFDTIEHLFTHIDLAIIATNSDVRANIVEKLVGIKNVKFILLEKLLFQKLSDYPRIENLLVEKGITAWVNHPRRCFPFYQELRKFFYNSETINYQAQGGNWGLCCNGLHLIDHLAYLSGTNDPTVYYDSIRDSQIIESKRSGFVEIAGLLTGRIGKHSFEIFCHPHTSPVIITISSEKAFVIIDEIKGWARLASKASGWEWADKIEKIIYFQSELTHVVASEIINKGTCDLPTFKEATILHIPYITTITDHLNSVSGENYDYCPIT